MWTKHPSEILNVTHSCVSVRVVNFNLAEDWCVSVSQGIAEVLGCQQAWGQAVHTEAFRVQQRVCKGAHLSPVDVQHAGTQLLS